MQRVVIVLRFTSACLGHVKRARKNDVIYGMLRDCDGRVMFLPTWWRNQLQYAAQVQGRWHNEARKIDWSPYVDGRLVIWRRTVARRPSLRYAVHEAYRPGECVTVRAILPDGLGIADFTEMLQLVGEYRGISPFRGAGVDGTFEVVSVAPVGKIGDTTHVRSGDSPMREPD